MVQEGRYGGTIWRSGLRQREDGWQFAREGYFGIAMTMRMRRRRMAMMMMETHIRC